MERKFSIKEAINFGWETVKNNLKFFLLFSLLVLIFSFLPVLADEFAKKANTNTIYMLCKVLYWVFTLLSVFVSLGAIKISLKFVNKEKAEIADLFSQYDVFINYFVGTIMYSVVVFVGIFLLIIPGIIWSIKFRYFGYLIVEENLKPLEAFKKSAKITQGVKWQLLEFSFVLILISLLGFMALFVGSFITIPLVLLAEVFVYKKLKEEIPSTNPITI